MIFFTDEHGWLKTLRNDVADDREPNAATEGRKGYTVDFLQLNKANTKSLTRDIAAVSFPLAGANFTRVRTPYYLH